MKKIICAFFALIVIIACADNSKVGNYTKEALPDGFRYEITEDKSDAYSEKNQLYVRLSEKLTEGQIATLADELFNSKEKQKRFYIFYSLEKSKDAHVKWATSHFDPELEIKIIGSTVAQEKETKKNSGKVDGNIIGKFYEEEVTSASYTIFEKDKKIYIKSLLKNGQSSENEMRQKGVENGTKLEYVSDSYNGEYFILTTDKTLDFYNNSNEKFATGYEF